MKKKLALIASIITIGFFCYFYYQSPMIQDECDMNNIIVVGISPDYPPYAQIDLATGQIVGLEVDVINEIAQRLGKKLIIKDMPFNTLIVELIAGQIDVIAAGMCPSEERKKTILFSYPYIDNDENVMISKKSNPAITDIQDVFGKPVAVNIGYTAETYLSKYPQIELIRLESPADGFMALKTDSVYAFTVAKSIFNKFLDKQPQGNDYQYFALPSSADACALAFAKSNSRLQQEIDPIINQMIEDGTMQVIKKKWGFE